MSTLVTIKNKIVEKLQATDTLKEVYDYPASNNAGRYPYATVILRRSDADIRSTSHNLRTRSFWIRIYQEVTKTGQGPSNGERIITEVVDEVERAFDMDTTLSGTVHYCEPLLWNGTYRNREHDARVLEAQLDTKEIVNAS